MLDIKKEVKENDVLVVFYNSRDCQKTLIDIAKGMGEKFENIGYVTLNTSYCNMIEILEKKNIPVKKFFFIDAVTSRSLKSPPLDNCIFVIAPNALTELSIAITKAIRRQNLKVIIFDSLSTLLIYEKKPILLEFLHSIIRDVRRHKIKIIFTALKSDMNSSLMVGAGMLVDKMVVNN